MRSLLPQTRRIIEEMKKDASPRFQEDLKTPEQVRNNALSTLASKSYASKPVVASDRLKAMLGQGREG